MQAKDRDFYTYEIRHFAALMGIDQETLTKDKKNNDYPVSLFDQSTEKERCAYEEISDYSIDSMPIPDVQQQGKSRKDIKV